MEIKDTVAEEIKANQKVLEDAFKKLEEAKLKALDKFIVVEEKEIIINGEKAKVGLTKGGAVIIFPVSNEEAKKYFDTLL